jgi:SAM-dependent methyltransferase
MITGLRRTSPQLAVRRVEGQRLAYYGASTDPSSWDQRWQRHLSRRAYTWAEQGRLGSFEDPLTRYLAKGGRILEAGCGLAQLVVALRARGYDCEGVDWGERTVRAVRELYPNLPIRVGDVTDLDVPDGYYQGYVSLGVAEHCKGGPEPFLEEAYRVLSSDGVMLISVPHFHWLRRAKARLGLYRGRPDGLSFYQYAFTPGEMRDILRREGFAVVDTYGSGSFKGIRDEIPPLRWIAKWRPIHWLLERAFFRWKWGNRRLGHMMLLVCRKDPALGRSRGVTGLPQ